MKLMVVCSSLDLKAPFSATPAWWQLCKGLYEVGASLAVTAYHGRFPKLSGGGLIRTPRESKGKYTRQHKM